MKKFLILVMGLSMTAASCNLLGPTGARGVMKSEDGGNTFAPANAMEKGDITGLNVNTMTMDPGEPDIMYVGSSQGIHKTSDAAAKWAHVMTGMRIGDIVVDPRRSSNIYAAGISGNNGRIIRTADGGETWRDIYTEPTKNNAVLSLAMSPANSRILLAGLNNGELLRSVDEGTTWQLVQDLSNPVLELEYTDSTTAYALTQGNGLYVTLDQGSNWSPVPVSVQIVAPESGYQTPTTNVFYDMAFDPKLKGVIFLASQQGLLRTMDSGANWTLMTLPVTNETLTVSSVAVNPTNSNNLFIAVGSTMFKTTNGGMTWETKKLPGEQGVRHILVNPQEPNNIYLGLGSR